jgi:hypothetical protein
VVVEGDLYHGHVPDGAVYVGRAAPGLRRSRWANPHRVGACRQCGLVHDQADAVATYTAQLLADPDQVAAARAELAGRDLACWCRIGPCHAGTLLTIANPAADASGASTPGNGDRGSSQPSSPWTVAAAGSEPARVTGSG